MCGLHCTEGSNPSLSAKIGQRIMRFLLRYAALFAFLIILFVSYLLYGGVLEEDTVIPLLQETEEVVPKIYTLAFAGDILVHSSVYDEAKVAEGEYDFIPFFRNVKGEIRRADVAICHLETLIAKKEGEYSNYPRFQIPYHIADALYDTGFDGCSLASNHAADGGAGSVRETIRHFDRVGLQYTGAIAEEGVVFPALYSLADGTVAHFSYTYGTNGIPVSDFSLNVIDIDAIKRDVGRLKQVYEDSFVILSLHWGDEYSSEVSEYQEGIIEELQNGDIDIIVGHHAHVVQPILKRGSMHVLTGLGNFISSQIPELCSCPEEVQDGVIALVDIVEDGDSFSVSDISLVPTIVDFSDFTVLRTEKDAPTEHVTQRLLDISSGRTRAVMEGEM